METLLDIARLMIGGLLLYLGAEWLVKGSAGLARALGVKPLVIGLTVVAYGTSAPELAVSSAAILEDSSAIALGNVIGSCIANLGLILGLTALFTPPFVDGRLIRREAPILFASAVVVPLVLIDGTIELVEAALLTACAILFTLYTLLVSSGDVTTTDIQDPDADTPPAGGESKLRLGTVAALGMVLLIIAGELFVDGARGIALSMGMSERLVGLTVVAIGNSLPELAASLIAAFRGHSSMAVGNVVGSNILNVFFILGVTGVMRPVEGDLDAIGADIGFLLGITLLGILFMRGERRLHRLEGVFLLAAYAAFVVLAAVGW